ncbi:hypothetical protein L1785_16765 [Antribacter sp. KLBMP9083]|uniref:Uncharacterized protein n=1 Tax=Antribacter soli TaxID=2910976 RepID=A0AA41QGB7_9MICO|nr:hypothetical protein [Antribacter soli]MCF4122632.1 hypothetical protein [Antribacter soli]
MVATLRHLLAMLATAALLLGVGVSPAAASETEPEPPSSANAPEVTVLDTPVLPQQIQDLPALDPGPDEEVVTQREPNKATQEVGVLPGLDPVSGRPDVPTEQVTPEPAVGPGSVALPTRPASELVDATAADALATLDAAGRLSDGAPDLDAEDLQPQIDTSTPADASRIATRLELQTALAGVELATDLGVDPLAILEALPDGVPRVTYRVCSESASQGVSCSMRLPLAVPAIVDATGDGSPDVLADLLPAASVDDVTAAVNELLEAQELLADAQDRLANLLELIQDPLYLLTHPGALLEVLELQGLVEDLTAQVAAKTTALLEVVHLGLAMLEVRLPTSEYAGEDLPAHVWAVYDIPGAKRLSVGFDGYRRGTSLSSATLGLFTFSPFSTLAGELDINAHLAQLGAGDAMAVTAGFSSVADTEGGEAFDPTVASARFSPVPTLFSTDVEVKPATEERDQTASVDVTSTTETRLDAIVLANARSGDAPEDRFVQAVVDQVPTSVSAQLTWSGTGDRADLAYEADSAINDLLFADHTYAGGTDLTQATQATAQDLPASFDAALATAPSGSVTLDYAAASRMTGIQVAYFDRAGELVLRGGLDDIPTQVSLIADAASGRALFDAPGTLGAAFVDASQGLADYPPATGDHVTLVTDGADLGVSARVTGLRRVDAYFDGHPRVTTSFVPGGQAFDAAGNLDGIHRARAHISNLPADARIDVSTVDQQVRYAASEMIGLASMAYTNTQEGPSVTAAVHQVPATVALDYAMGETPRIVYEASSGVPQVDFFASPDHVANLDPTGDQYLSALIEDIPATIDVGMNLSTQHLDGTLSSRLGGIDLTARFDLAGRTWTAGADLDGIPTRFDADWADGAVRARALTGTMDSIDLYAGNHPGHTAPTGLRLAATYHESTGDIEAAVRTRNLSHVEYADTGETQNFRLETDTGGDPVHVDVDAVLAGPDGTDDTQLAVLGRVDNLPATMDVTFTGERLTYTADRHIGLTLEARLGKIAALGGLGAPLYDNGVGAVARTCTTGAGCAAEAGSPFCPEGTGCLGLVGTISMQGLPTQVTADLANRTVTLTGYRSPSDTLNAYVRLIGMIDDLPDLRAEAELTGLPDSLDLTVGPITVGDGTIRAGYDASAALGALTLRAQADTSYEAFPHLRARAEVSGLPQAFDLAAVIGQQTTVTMTNSASVARIGLAVTGAEQGYLDAALTEIPAQAEVAIDMAGSLMTGTTSAPLGGVTVLANNLPYQGDTWGAWLEIAGIPSGFQVGWGNGTFGFTSSAGTLARAAAAVTNHAGATAPVGSHLAVGYRESAGTIDASASVSGLSSATYGTQGSTQSFDLDVAAQIVGLDADVVLEAGGVDDTRLALSGQLRTPNAVTMQIADGKYTYTADTTTGLRLHAEAGKIAALEGLGAPLFDNGVAARVSACEPGQGCSEELLPEFCAVVDGCFGAVMNLNLPGLPTLVAVDVARQTVDIDGLRAPGGSLRLYVEALGTLVDVPRAEGLVTLDGLPATVDVFLGPFRFGAKGKGKELALGYEASADVGTLTAQADAETADYGDWRGRVYLDPVPRTLEVTGDFGEESAITTNLAAPVETLEIMATAVLGGQLPAGTGSALFRLTDVPDAFTFRVAGSPGEDSMAVPPVVYDATASDGDGSTLDGLVEVEADLIAAFPIAGVPISIAGNVVVEFDNLGAKTGVIVGPDGIQIDSGEYVTDRIALGASINSAFAPYTFDKEVVALQCAGIDVATGSLVGHVNVPEISVDDMTVQFTDVANVALLPSRGVSWLATGVSGDYGSLTIDIAGMTIEPDVAMNFRIDYLGGGDPTDVPLLLLDEGETVTGTRFHVSRDGHWGLAGTVPLPLAPDLPIYTDPGKTQAQVNHIEIAGSDGNQVINYLDVDPFPAPISENLRSVGLHLTTMYLLNPFGPADEEDARTDDPANPDDGYELCL